jgi:ATP-dependent RNA helicase RhlE
MKFADLRLAEPILRALQTQGYTVATPIQAQAIPHALTGRDVLGIAQTGTGKTAAFALPILQRLASPEAAASHQPKPRCLVLCPTRELVTQIHDGFRDYGRNLSLRRTVIFGGVNQRGQVDSLRRGCDIVVATPGRLLDLLQQGHVDLSRIEVLVLDEADRMLDMGFIHDIKRIVARLPQQRQTMLFSATMPQEIRRLAGEMMQSPAVVQIAPAKPAAERIEQFVYFVDQRHKPDLLAHLVNEMPMARAIVFTRTKHGADRVVRQLHVRGIRAEAIHGNKSQNARQRALHNFKTARIGVLVATDVASRGIDIDDVSHVVNFDLTHEPETYVHRIGRTARAGAAGVAVSFCDRTERDNLREIERLIRRSIEVRTDVPKFESRPPRDERSTDAPRPAEAATHRTKAKPSRDQRQGEHRHGPTKPHRRGETDRTAAPQKPARSRRDEIGEAAQPFELRRPALAGAFSVHRGRPSRPGRRRR